jgi:ubiquinone/menaquinone biosynthesis C-methylase UbiE
LNQGAHGSALFESQSDGLKQMIPETTGIRNVCEFWNTEACGAHSVPLKRGTAEFYDKYREFRYRTEWHIPLLVPFGETNGKRVLEIGCGNGADGVTFAEHGAEYTGVDLTETAVDATRQHFDVLGLRGTFQIENAENLSFPDGSFDFVYSHGVLHHTPHPDVAFREVYRVLKPGARALLMLYHKHSLNYYLRIMGYMRVRALVRVLSRVGRFSQDRVKLSDELKGMRGNVGSRVWDLHYSNFLRAGWCYLLSENFVHHATDGPECPFAFVYTRQSVRRALAQFRIVETRVAHLPLRKYSLGRFVPLIVERQLASRVGWYLFVYLTK